MIKFKYKMDLYVQNEKTFALYFGNRGFMPAELIEGARENIVKVVTDAGYDYLIVDKDATKYGAVETRDEGRLYSTSHAPGRIVVWEACKDLYKEVNGLFLSRTI